MTAPWLFWGSDQTVEFRDSGLSMAGTVTAISPQLARIDYGRPETWSFFIGAKFERASRFPDPGTVIGVEVNFLVTLGLARTSRSIVLGPLNFEVSGDIPPSDNPVVGLVAWRVQSRTPVRIPADPANPLHWAEIDSFPAQSINCVATVRGSSGPAPSGWTGTMTVSAFFAPKSHVRPEWFANGRFTGGEDYGT